MNGTFVVVWYKMLMEAVSLMPPRFRFVEGSRFAAELGSVTCEPSIARRSTISAPPST